jgi:hypothetical protein
MGPEERGRLMARELPLKDQLRAARKAGDYATAAKLSVQIDALWTRRR